MTNKGRKSSYPNPTSFRLSKLAREILSKLSGALGISQAAVVELAIRAYDKMKESK
jgi:hypothetical protein